MENFQEVQSCFESNTYTIANTLLVHLMGARFK